MIASGFTALGLGGKSEKQKTAIVEQTNILKQIADSRATAYPDLKESPVETNQR